ncbi:MAG: hypothetical protein R8G01_07340 [Ilumatobacteraceae bacterium]|nr:hypothetical protein [Ilumatobacteraceae bacterium]
MPEHDPLTARLTALAPTVDMTASRLMFERHRSHDVPAKRRWLLPAAVATLLIAGVVGVWAIARPDQRSVAPVNSVDDGSGDGSDPEPSEPDLTATDVVLPLPAVGEPRLHTGTFGAVWVVHHDDGTVSVLNAVRPRSEADDGDPVEGLGHLVQPTEGGRSFVGREYVWDAHGRTLNGPRTADLVGFAGVVDAGEVQLFVSTAKQFDGEPDDPPVVLVDPPDLSGVPLLDLHELATLSFSGPIWRLLDATLVVRDGVGTLCSIVPNTSVTPLPELATCNSSGVSTAVRSTQPDITRWFFGPLLAEFDEFGQIVTVAPLGGETSRDDGPDDSASEAPAGDGWRELARVEGGGFEGFPTLVVDDARYAELGETIGTSTLAPVDFDTSVVIAFVTTSSPCLTPLATPFSPTGGWIEPRFEPATETGCRLSLVSYAFVIEIDRGRLGETVRLVVPERVDSLDSSRDRTVDDITYRVEDGALVAGGLRIGDGISADCRDPGGPVLSVPVTSVDSRSFSLEFRIDGRVVWEVGGSGAPLTVGGGLDLSLLSAEPGEIVASSTDPPAEFRRPFELSQEEIDRLVAECGPTAQTGVDAGPGWRLLSESWNTELTGLPHLAVDAGSLAELENDAGPLDVDLEEQFVVAVSVFGNSCPPVVAGVDVEAGQVAVRFKRSPAVTCDEVGIVYGFVVAVDRVATGDVVQVSATDPAGLPAAHETTFDVRSGDLLEGGLAFQQFEPVFVDCSEVAGGLDLIVPFETVIEREVVVVVHDTDGAPLATRSIALTTGRSEVRVPVPGDLAGDLVIGVTSIDPAAQLERTVTLTATDIADTTRRCAG